MMRAARIPSGLCLAAFLVAGFFVAVSLDNAAVAQQPSASRGLQIGNPQITWQVRNRFRLFREDRDFRLHYDSLQGRSIFEAEDALAAQSEGRGWSRNMIGRLCIDPAGRVSEPCTRDGVKESYLTPADHPVTINLSGTVPVGATCAWTFEDGEAPIQSTYDCAEPINFRVRYGRTTVATVEISSGAEAPVSVSANIAVRDILIAGLGDSIASGEGNPDRPVALSDDGFCFRSYLGGAAAMYFRPGRANFKGARACDIYDGNTLQAWQQAGAQWFNSPCHRSLYSYQTRTALALAVRNPQIAVTYLPLACTGATIMDGLLGKQNARECIITKSGLNCTATINAQVTELRAAMNAASQRQPDRQLDMILLSIGANDVNFSGLLANVIIEDATERALSRRAGVLTSPDEARDVMTRDLPASFVRLRSALKPLLGGDLSRAVYVSYGNPAFADGAPCPGGPAGFDIHPSFNADPQRLAEVAKFVQREFLPRIKNLALCSGGAICGANDRMSFVDQHQPVFLEHGFCARAASDPPFDRACFSPKGDSFVADIVSAPNNPMTCGAGASDFRTYASRARWIRDANDSYFAAMTYPQSAKAPNQPGDIHDATWGILSALYGGAIHPTAEGHAAMADAAYPAAMAVLGLTGAQQPVTGEPLAPPSDN